MKTLNNRSCPPPMVKWKGGGRKREIRVKGSVLMIVQAYHQRELKSCNRSKKHPWAVKSRSGWVEGNANERNKCAQDI